MTSNEVKPVTILVTEKFLKQWNQLIKEAYEEINNKLGIPAERIGKPQTTTYATRSTTY